MATTFPGNLSSIALTAPVPLGQFGHDAPVSSSINTTLPLSSITGSVISGQISLHDAKKIKIQDE